MRISSSVKYAIGVTATVAILAGCSSGGSQLAPAVGGGPSGMSSSAVHAKPVWTKYATLIPNNFLRVRGSIPGSPDVHINKKHKKKPVVYVGEFYGSSIFGYPKTNPGNNAPLCSITGVSYANDVAGDNKKNVIDPDGGTRSVIVFKPNCGAVLGSFSDPYGQPSDAASADAGTGTIAVGNILDTSQAYGSISVCTITGCTANLVNTANMDNYVAGVALGNNGDCWGSSYNSAGAASITYFKGCAGSGQASTGVMNTTYGGLDIDAKGNLVSIDFQGNGGNGAVYVYKGCNPACTLVSGPLALHGSAIFGKLNKAGNAFQAVEYVAGQVDVYKYADSGTSASLTYQYSYNNGLTAANEPEGIAYSPRSQQ